MKLSNPNGFSVHPRGRVLTLRSSNRALASSDTAGFENCGATKGVKYYGSNSVYYESGKKRGSKF